MEAGEEAGSGQPCQKRPSTKKASLSFGKTKSGLPKIGQLRRQPVMEWARMIVINRSSVSRLPRERMSDITAERFFFVKTSGRGEHAAEIC